MKKIIFSAVLLLCSALTAANQFSTGDDSTGTTSSAAQRSATAVIGNNSLTWKSDVEFQNFLKAHITGSLQAKVAELYKAGKLTQDDIMRVGGFPFKNQQKELNDVLSALDISSPSSQNQPVFKVTYTEIDNDSIEYKFYVLGKHQVTSTKPKAMDNSMPKLSEFFYILNRSYFKDTTASFGNDVVGIIKQINDLARIRDLSAASELDYRALNGIINSIKGLVEYVHLPKQATSEEEKS